MSSLYRVRHILTFQVAAKYTTNKLQTKKNVMIEDHFLNDIKPVRYSTSLYAIISVHVVTV